MVLCLQHFLLTPHNTAELHSYLPHTSSPSDVVAKPPQGGQTLEVSCDQLGRGEILEETVYLCTKGVGLRKMSVTVSCGL